MNSPIIALTAALSLWAQIAASHEFWISPEEYQVATGGQVQAHLRVGESFEGSSHSFIPKRFARFEAGPADAMAPVAGRLGDRPAMSVGASQPGLWVIVHETTDYTLTYQKWEKFLSFVARHDLGPIEAAHRARGLPESGFRESYRRFGKALVAVGDGAGDDQRLGLEVEIVAEANPYVLTGDALPVTLWRDGAPHAEAQLEVFTRLDNEVSYSVLRSDPAGHVDVPAPKGAELLLNFVVLEPRDGNVAAREPVWHSRWASLTFRVPD